MKAAVTVASRTLMHILPACGQWLVGVGALNSPSNVERPLNKGKLQNNFSAGHQLLLLVFISNDSLLAT